MYDPSYIAQGEQLNQQFPRRLGIQSNSGWKTTKTLSSHVYVCFIVNAVFMDFHCHFWRKMPFISLAEPFQRNPCRGKGYCYRGTKRLKHNCARLRVQGVKGLGMNREFFVCWITAGTVRKMKTLLKVQYPAGITLWEDFCSQEIVCWDEQRSFRCQKSPNRAHG